MTKYRVMKRLFERTVIVGSLLSIIIISFSCGTQTKIKRIAQEGVVTEVALTQERDFEVPDSIFVKSEDTIKVVGLDGKEVYFMKTVLDDDGNAIASQVLSAAVVTARFRHVAERNGILALEFQIIVPELLMDSQWQLQYQPIMFMNGDSLNLDKIFVTGKDFRKKQYRGYQQYQRFLDRIVSDSTKFIDAAGLEIFLERYIPKIYAFKSDSTFVSDEEFQGYMGVTEREAIDHYTRKARLNYNEKLKAKRDAKYRKYVKAPIVSKGIRLDTVLQSSSGNYVYNYVQELSVKGREKIKKIDVVLGGEIYEFDHKVMDIQRTSPLSYYISSLSAFVDGTERYQTIVVERNATSVARYDIQFPAGKSELIPDFGENGENICKIKKDLRKYLFDSRMILDSVTICASASPEGSVATNAYLSARRSKSISSYFKEYMNHYLDSLDKDKAISVNLDETYDEPSDSARKTIGFISSFYAENWSLLNRLVDTDTTLSVTDKEDYYALSDIDNLDVRESRMKGEKWYQYIRTNLYPRLRVVDFEFNLHRDGMVKDTIHTTVLDTLYMSGVQAIRDRDYEEALRILGPYNDYNTAVAYCALEKNVTALNILEKEKKTARVEYLLAIIYSRLGEEEKAVQSYMNCCHQDSQFVHRGNLDPEISVLIKRYGLNKEDEEYY